jgi:hypothetical protein
MILISDPIAARRLADAIVADLVLYQEARIAAATNVRIALARPLAEARGLYESRVVAELHPVFESAVDARLGSALATYRGTAAPREPELVERETSDDDRGTGGPGRLLLASVIVMLLGLSVIWWMLRGRG